MVDLDPFLVKEEGGAKLCLRLTKHPPTKTLKTIKRTRIKGGKFVGLDSYSWFSMNAFVMYCLNSLHIERITHSPLMCMYVCFSGQQVSGVATMRASVQLKH